MKKFVSVAKSILLIIFLSLLVYCNDLHCQTSGTLHFIYFSDTNDSEIGKSSEEANRYFINNFIPMVKANTSMDVRSYCFYGTDFQLPKLNEVIRSLQTGSNDAIFFYYTGHGYNQGTNDFPSLTLGLRSESINSRTKSLLEIYNDLRAKPHRLLLVIAEACNAVYGNRSESGTYTGSYDLYEGDNTNLQKLFAETHGDYLMSSSIKGQKSFCPSGSLGYFTRGFRDALDERMSNFTIMSFLDKVAMKTTRYAADYAVEDQHPQWLTGAYSSSKINKPSIPTKSVLPVKGKIKKVNVVEQGGNVIVKVSFDVDGMKGKNGRVICYFYDENGKILKDQNSSYHTVYGEVSSGRNINPSYDSSVYTDFEVRIPKSELHLQGNSQKKLKVKVVVGDNSSNFKAICSSGYVSFTVNPPFTNEPVVKGKFKNVNVVEQGGNVVVKVSFDVDGMKGKNGRVVCYFYDENGKALKDRNSSYYTVDGEVSSGRDIKPSYDSSVYTDFEIKIPKSEFHLEGSQQRKLKVKAVVADKSKGFKQICNSGYVSFTVNPPFANEPAIKGNVKEEDFMKNAGM